VLHYQSILILQESLLALFAVAIRFQGVQTS
jgi:hypothetical protein